MVNQDGYRLTGIPPAMSTDIVQVRNLLFKVLQIEPLYYQFKKISGGVEIGFSSGIESVPDLIPPKNKLYYITNIGVNGDMRFQIRYQSGSPRNTVGANSQQFLDRIQAPYDKPWTFKFVVLSGDTLEVDVRPAFSGLKARLWFYGYKMVITPISTASGEVVILEDVREQ